MIKNILNRFKNNKAKQEVLSNQLSLSKQQRALKTEEVVKLVEDITLQENPNLINQTKTLSRLDVLETFSLWSTTNINELNAQQQINTSDISTLKDKVDSIDTKKADFVLDTTDNQYKNVKSIIIDKATKADLLFDAKTQTYTTIDKVSVGNAILADNATQAEYSTTAGVANQIKYKNGVFHLDTIMSDYYTQDQIDKLLNNNKPTSLIAGNNIKIENSDNASTLSTTDDIRVNTVEAKEANLTLKSTTGTVLVNDTNGVISIRELKTTQDNLIQQIRNQKPFTYKGEYVSSQTYQLNEIVSNKKREFLSLKDNNTQPLTDKESWVEFGLDGINPEDFYNKTEIDSKVDTINDQIGGVNTTIALKADKSYVDTQLANKANLQADNTFSSNNTFTKPIIVNNSLSKTTSTELSLTEQTQQSPSSLWLDYIQPNSGYRNYRSFGMRVKLGSGQFDNVLKFEARPEGIWISTSTPLFDFNSKELTNIATPINQNSATNKAYVDTQLNTKPNLTTTNTYTQTQMFDRIVEIGQPNGTEAYILPRNNSGLTTLKIGNSPGTNDKRYNIDLENRSKIVNVPNPSANQDIANKQYVDGLVKTKKIVLNTRDYYSTYTFGGMRTYRYVFFDIGIEREKFISGCLESSADLFEDNQSYQVSFSWTSSNRLIVIITNVNTTDDIHTTYDTWKVVLKYL